MNDKPSHRLGQLKQETAAGNVASRSEAKKVFFPPEQLRKVDDQLSIVQLIAGVTGKGEDFYAYVTVRPSVYQEFMDKMGSNERVNVENYGKVLKKGFGKVPSDDVKRHMEETYGIDHDFLQHVAEELERRHKNDPKTT